MINPSHAEVRELCFPRFFSFRVRMRSRFFAPVQTVMSRTVVISAAYFERFGMARGKDVVLNEAKCFVAEPATDSGMSVFFDELTKIIRVDDIRFHAGKR